MLLAIFALFGVTLSNTAVEECDITNALKMNIIKHCVVPGMIALTYDDGVSPYTSELLNILEDEGIRATFFVLGTMLRSDMSMARSLLKRMWKSGHDLGSHSFDHPYLTQISDDAIEYQMASTDNLISQILGVTPLAMRPPYGDYDGRVLKILDRMGYMVVTWSVDSNDWRMANSPSSQIVSSVCSEIEPRSRASEIILFHDTVKASVHAQRQIIRGLKAKGYKFGNLSECLGGVSLYKKA